MCLYRPEQCFKLRDGRRASCKYKIFMYNRTVKLPYFFFSYHLLFAWKYARSGAGWQFFKHWLTCRLPDVIHILKSSYKVTVVNAPQCDYKHWSPGKGRTLSMCFLYFPLSFLNHLLSVLANMHVKMGLPRISRHRGRKTIY